MYKANYSWGLIALFLMLPGLSTAQENYLPGYMVTTRGDTIRGLIDYRNWKTNPGKISFKTYESASKAVYTPLDLRMFSVKDEKYAAGIVTVDIAPLDLDRLLYEDKLVPRIDTVFLQTLVEGPKSLFYYFDASGRDYFFIWKDGTFELLEMRRSIKSPETSKRFFTNKKYIGQLGTYLKGCPTMHLQLAKARYEQSDLEKLFDTYYACSGDKPVFEKKQEKNLVYFGVLAGGGLTKLDFSHPSYFLGKMKFPAKASASIALSLEFFLTRYQQKWSVNNELQLSSYQVNAVYREIFYPEEYTDHDVSFRNTYIKLNNMLRFRYPAGKCSWFANLGISNGIAVKSEATDSRFIKVYSQERRELVSPLSEVRKYEQGLLFGAGLSKDRYSCEFRYELGNGVSKQSLISSTTQRLSLLLGYRF